MDEPAPPRQRLTLRDLATSLGVSKTTVSNAFSRPDQLSPELRARVLEAARVAGYAGPDAVGRMLRTRRAGAVGLILPESLPFAMSDPVVSELIRGIADACEERRLGLLIVPGGLHAADTRMITDVAVDGFVAYSLPRGANSIEAALGRGIPIVVVDQPRLPGVTTVAVDDAGGAREVARLKCLPDLCQRAAPAGRAGRAGHARVRLLCGAQVAGIERGHQVLHALLPLLPLGDTHALARCRGSRTADAHTHHWLPG